MEKLGVRVGDVTVSRVTLHNAKMVLDKKIGPGTIIQIRRSGDVIPYLEKVVKSTKASLPKPTQFGPYHLAGVHFVLDKPKENSDFRVKRMARFFAEMGADFMREKTVRKLYDAGFTNLSKILKAKPEAFVGDGISEAGAYRLHKAIHTALDKKVPLTQLMAASSTFPRGMGERRFQSLGERYDLLKLAELDEAKQRQMIQQVEGWKDKTADAFIKGLPQFIKWLDIVKVPYVNDTGAAKVKKQVKGPLNGVLVSWTGYRDKTQEEAVQAAGGVVAPFGSKTTVLLYSESGKQSSKVAKAESRGIKVMTWQQFSRKYGL